MTKLLSLPSELFGHIGGYAFEVNSPLPKVCKTFKENDEHILSGNSKAVEKLLCHALQTCKSSDSIPQALIEKLQRISTTIFSLDLRKTYVFAPKFPKTTLKEIIELFPNLETVNVGQWELTEEGINALCNLPKLKILEFTETTLTDANLNTIAAKQQQLISLTITDSRTITNNGLKAAVGHLKQLTSVNFSDCNMLQDDLLIKIATDLSDLQSLDISDCPLITNAGLGQIILKGQALEEINAARCKNIEDTVFEVVTSSRPHMKKLNFSGTKISDFSLERIAKHMPNTESLFFAGCPNITDSGIALLASHLPKLHTVNLSQIKALTDAAIHSLLVNLNSLETLTLSGPQITGNIDERVPIRGSVKHLIFEDCSSLTNSGIKQITNKLPKLETLYISGSDQLTPICLETIMTNLQQITTLSVRSCLHISRKAIQKIKTSYPRLKLTAYNPSRTGLFG